MNRYTLTYKDLRQSEPSMLMLWAGAALALAVLYFLAVFFLSINL